jgi:ElaB/YqjD/DUF883 family membrane-anchored ribosome-binding protein
MGKRADINIEENRFGAVSRVERKPEEIEADIGQTRAGLEDTIDEIKERFSSEHIKGELKEATIGRAKAMLKRSGEKMKDAGSTISSTIGSNVVSRTIVKNPVPAVLAGVGLGWLILKAARANGTSGNGKAMGWDESEMTFGGQPMGSEEGMGLETDMAFGEQRKGTAAFAEGLRDKAGKTFDQIAGETSELADQARAKTKEVVDQAKMKAEQLRVQARNQGQALKRRYQRSLQDTPLAMAAAALVLGMAAGFIIPETERERGLMGETRNKFLGKAKEVARDTMQKMERVALEVERSAERKAKQEGMMS